MKQFGRTFFRSYIADPTRRHTVLVLMAGVLSGVVSEVNADESEHLSSALGSAGASRLFQVQWWQSVPNSEPPNLETPGTVVGDHVIVATGTGELVCISAVTGVIRWRNALTNLVSSLTADSSGVYASIESKGLKCFESDTGELRWEYTEQVGSNVVLHAQEPGIVLAGVSPDRLVALASNDGTVLWQHSWDGFTRSVPSGNLCYFASDRDTLVACTPASGEIAWRTRLTGPLADVAALRNGPVVVSTADGSVSRLHSGSGAILWTSVGSIRSAPVHPRHLLLMNTSHVVVFESAGINTVRALSLHDGKTAWTDQHRGLRGSPISMGPYLLYKSDETLVVHRAYDGVRIREVPVPSPLHLIGFKEGAVFGMACGTGVFRARLDYAQIVRPIGSLQGWPFPVNAADAAAILFLLVLGLGLIVGPVAAFAVFDRPRIPPTSQTAILQSAMLFVGTGVCLLTAYSGGLGVWSLRSDTPSWTHVLFDVSLFLPITVAAIAFLRFTLRRRGRFGSDALGDPAAVLAVNRAKNLVAVLRREMGIEPPVSVLLSEAENHTPYISGATARNLRLVLPRNFWTLVRSAAMGDTILAQNLARFVLAHELAHVKNKDYRALPIALSLRGPWPASAVVIVALYLLSSRFDPGWSGGLLDWPPVLTFCFATFVLIPFTATFLRVREKLADATASLFVAPDVLNRLTISNGHGEDSASPIERFVLSTASFAAAPVSYLGFGCTRSKTFIPFARIVTPFRITIQRYVEGVVSRMRRVNSKKDLVSTAPLPTSWVAILAGLLLLVLYLCFLLVRHLIVETYLFSIGHIRSAETVTPLHTAYEELGALYRAAPAWRLLEVYGLFACGLLSASILVLPLRDALAPRSVKSRLVLVDFLGRILVAGTVLCVGALFFDSGFSISQSPFSAHARIALLTFFLLSAAFLMYSTWYRTGFRRLTRAAAPLLGLAVALFGLAIVLWTSVFTEISLPTRLLLLLASLCSAILLHLILGKYHPLGNLFDVEDEGLILGRTLFSRWKAQVPSKRGQHFRLVGRVGGALLTIVLVPAFVLSVLLYPWLVKADMNHLENPDFLRDMYLASASEHDDLKKPLRFEARAERAFARMGATLVGPDRMFPSAGLLLVTVATLTPILVISSAVATFYYRRQRSRRLREFIALSDIEEILGYRILPAQEKAIRCRLAIAETTNDGPYVSDRRSAPLMSLTCKSVELLQNTGIDQSTQRRLLQWVQECEVGSGGFAPIPGLNATPHNTAAAIGMLTSIGLESTLQPQLHRGWIENETLGLLTDPPRDRASAWLEQMCCLVNCAARLKSINAQDAGFRERILGRTILNWHRSRKSVFDTCHCVSIFTVLGDSQDAALNPIRQHWLQIHEPMLTRISPRHRLAEIKALLESIRALHPESYKARNSIIQLRDTLEKAYRIDDTVIEMTSI